MGYTHYWSRKAEIDATIFQKIKDDFLKLIPVFKKYDIVLGNAEGEGEPVITDENIEFNGKKNCGHPPNYQLVLTWPDREVVENEDSENAESDSTPLLDGLKLKNRTCNGTCSFEPFIFPLVLESYPWQEPDDDGFYFQFCKTRFSPYDLAVTAFLVIAKHHLQDQIHITSDGQQSRWFDAKMICQMELGYGMDIEIKSLLGR